MATQTTGMERALGAIGTTFRMTRLYPPIHPALVEAVRQVSDTLPALWELGTVEWKVGATGLHWQGHHLLPRNSQVAELAGLLFARGIRTIRADPGVAADDVLALFAVATGTIPPDHRSLGHLTLTGRRTQRALHPDARARHAGDRCRPFPVCGGASRSRLPRRLRCPRPPR
jgi:hypothetical protein